MPSTSRSTAAEVNVSNEESLEGTRAAAENQESEFDDFMQHMGYDVSSLLEKACPVFVKNPNKSSGPKCTSTPEHTLSFEQDWSISSMSDCEEGVYKQGMYLENCSVDGEKNYRDFTTCTWETLESTRTQSSKPTSTSSATELEYINVEHRHSKKESMHSESDGDFTPMMTMDEEQTCNKGMTTDTSLTIFKTPNNQQEPVVTKSPDIIQLNLKPCVVQLERLKSEEFDKYMPLKKRLLARNQSGVNDVQLELNTDVMATEIFQNSTHTSRNDVTERKSIEDTTEHQENIDSSVSTTNNTPVRTTGTIQKLHRRIFTSSDFLTPLQKKIPQENNTDSNVSSTPTINCCPVKKRKVSSTKENVTHHEITEQFKDKNREQPSSNEMEKKSLVAHKNKKQLVFPKELEKLERNIKILTNDSVEPTKKEIIARIYKPKMIKSPSSDAVTSKKAAIIGEGEEGASPTAANTEVGVIAIPDVSVATEHAAGLNTPQNIKQKRNQSTATVSVGSQVMETDILAKSSRTKKRYRIVYLGPSVIQNFKNAKPDILGRKSAWNKT